MAFGDPGTSLVPEEDRKKKTTIVKSVRPSSIAAIDPYSPPGGAAPVRGVGPTSRPAPPPRKSVLDLMKQNNPKGLQGINYSKFGNPDWDNFSTRGWVTPAPWMQNLDTMQSETRFRDALGFYETGGAGYKLSVGEKAQLIRDGVLAYGKVEDGPYRVPVVNVGTRALDQFLRDNYTANKKNEIVKTRRAKKNGLEYSNTFVNLASGSAAQWFAGQRFQDPGGTAPNLYDASKRNTGYGEDYDYGKMAVDFVRDENKYVDYQSKIVEEILDNGGGAQLERVISGDFSPEAIDALRPYMYSPDGEYGDVQERWIDEVFYGGAQLGQSIAETRFNIDNARREELQEDRAKEIAEVQKARSKDVAATSATYFNTDPTKGSITPTEDYFTNAITLTASGMGDMITPAALNTIFYSDTQLGRYKDLTDSEKQALYSTVLTAMQAGQPVHPFMFSRAVAFEEELGQKGLLPTQQAALSGFDMEAYAASPVVDALLDVPGIGPALVGVGAIGGATQEEVAPLVATEGGPLSGTPLSEGFSLKDLGSNAIKGVIRGAVGMPQGFYYGAIDPTGMAKAVAEDYKYRYGSMQGFKESSYLDPTLPIMDALTVLSVAGSSAKLAQISRIKAASLNKGTGLTARQYAKLARQASNGDEYAAMVLGEATTPGRALRAAGYDMDGLGLNSAYNPTAMDRAAAFFEPRYRTFKMQEGMPKRESRLTPEAEAAVAATVEGGPGIALRRLAGNPLARGAQQALFYTQRQIGRTPGKVPQVVSTLPGIGYAFRFSRAMKEGNPDVLDLQAREMIYSRMIDEELKGIEMNTAEELAVMDMASGGMYSPANLRTIAFKRTEQAKAAGLDPEDPVIGMVEADYKLFDDASFMREYERAYNDMHGGENGGPRNARGEALVRASERLILLREKTTRLVDFSWDDSRATRALLLRYEVALEAADLMPTTVFDELGKRMDRIARLNGAYHWVEINKVDAGDIPNEDGVPLSAVETDRKDYLNEVVKAVNESMDYLRSDLTNRTKGNVPILILEDYVPRMIGDRGFVVARRVRLEGEFDNATGLVRRDSLIDDRTLLLPEELFLKVAKGPKKGQIAVWDNTKKPKNAEFTAAEERMMELVLNEMADIYPNARDFTDKVAPGNIIGRETFREMKNENKVVASGLLSFRYQEQIAAHRAAVNRRFKKDIEQMIMDEAEVISLADFDKDLHVPVKSARVYTDINAARAKARTTGGEVETVEGPNGQKAYVVNLQYFDITAATMKEMRLKRLLDWDEDVASKYFDDIKSLEVDNPNQAILVVPKYYAKVLRDSYKRSENLAMKILDSSTDLFKILTLSLNPRFVPQQVIGSSVMLMMAYPEHAPAIMSRVMEYGARQVAKKVDKKWFKGDEDYEFISHADDYDVMQEYLPRDVTENIYAQDAMLGVQDRIPSNKMRYLVNSGYLLAFAWEKNLRVAVARKMALQYPGFSTFAKSKAVDDALAGRWPESLGPLPYETQSRFSVAFRLLADKNSPYHNPLFLREVRHGTDMVAGNYRDFTNFERQMRNFLIPFYAWTRHSALFTKRMVQERPLTTNSLWWIGNYGYEQTFERGGLPQWLMDSLPMPAFVEEVLGLDPLRMNRVSVGSVLPFGTFGDTIGAGSNLAFGKQYGSASGVDFLNPYVRTAIEQQTGRSLLTGAPVESKGLPQMIVDGTQSFPVIGATINLFKSASSLNTFRGRETPEDLWVDVEDPNSEFSIPEDKLSQRFTTREPAGVFNLFSPVRAYSLSPEGIQRAIEAEYEAAGISVPNKESESYRGVYATINRIQRWKRKRDYVLSWIEYHGDNADPALVERAQRQLAEEFPEIPSNVPPGLVQRVLNGYVAIPGGDQM